MVKTDNIKILERLGRRRDIMLPVTVGIGPNTGVVGNGPSEAVRR